VSQERTEALVLRGVDFSESSRIITLLTPGRGQVAVIAKGARRKNSPSGPMLDTFNVVEAVIYWKDGRGIQTLGDVSLLCRHTGLKRDLARGAYGAFVLELVGKTCPENVASEGIFRRVLDGLAALDGAEGDVRSMAAGLSLALLDEAGYGMAGDQCGRCGAAMPVAAGFALADGLLCRRCPGESGVSRAAVEGLAGLARGDGGGAAAVAEVFTLVWRYASYQLETELKSVRVLERMLA